MSPQWVVDLGSGPEMYGEFVDTTNDHSAVMRWNGAAWIEIIDPAQGRFDNMIDGLCAYDDGTGPALYASGRFTQTDVNHQNMYHVAKWTGTQWQGLLPPLTSTYTATVGPLVVLNVGLGAQMFLLGDFLTWPGGFSNNILAWNGTSWSGVGGGLTYFPYTGIAYDNGSGPALYVTNSAVIGGILQPVVLKWDGFVWSPAVFGFSYQGQWTIPTSMVVYDHGAGPRLLFGGVFDHIAGTPALNYAEWDGTTLYPIAGAPSVATSIVRMAVHNDGGGSALYVNPASQAVVRWDGANWLMVGGAGIPIASFDDGMGGGPALWCAGTVFGGNLNSPYTARLYTACNTPIDTFCRGDGRFITCPCSNYGALGRGCSNSTTFGALLGHTGSTNPDTLQLTSSSEPSTATSIFVQSDTLRVIPTFLGSGILCLGGYARRLYVKTAVAGTAIAPEALDPSITARSAALGDPLVSGSIRYYQVWYRDSTGTCSGGTFNLSNGLRVVW